MYKKKKKLKTTTHKPALVLIRRIGKWREMARIVSPWVSPVAYPRGPRKRREHNPSSSFLFKVSSRQDFTMKPVSIYVQNTPKQNQTSSKKEDEEKINNNAHLCPVAKTTMNLHNDESMHIVAVT